MNATSQHTPGPWFYNRDEGGVHGHVITVQECEIAEAFSECLGEEQAAANARVIAASPDLLFFADAVAVIMRSTGANLCSTASQKERSQFISCIFDAWNDNGYPALAKAKGMAS